MEHRKTFLSYQQTGEREREKEGGREGERERKREGRREGKREGETHGVLSNNRWMNTENDHTHTHTHTESNRQSTISAKEEMTRPRVVSDLLMLLPSLRRSPRAPVFPALSLPARSTRLILATFSVPS